MKSFSFLAAAITLKARYFRTFVSLFFRFWHNFISGEWNSFAYYSRSWKNFRSASAFMEARRAVKFRTELDFIAQSTQFHSRHTQPELMKLNSGTLGQPKVWKLNSWLLQPWSMGNKAPVFLNGRCLFIVWASHLQVGNAWVFSICLQDFTKPLFCFSMSERNRCGSYWIFAALSAQRKIGFKTEWILTVLVPDL